MAFYPKGASYTRTFKMISSSDHISLKTAASPAVQISKAGGAFGSPAGSISEISLGWYKVSLTATDTNTAGDLSFICTGFGTDDTDFSDQIMDISTGVIGVNVALYNNKIATTDANNLPNVNTQDWQGSTAASDVVQGVPIVDVKYWNSVAATADASGFPNVNVRDWNAQTVTSLPSGFLSTTFPSGTVASTTNITAATGVTLGSVPGVNTIQWNGQTATYDANKLPNVNTQDWNGTVVTSLPSGFLTTTFPSAVASPTNITAATGVTLAAVPPVNVIQWLATQPLALSSQQVQAVVPSSTVVASVSGAVGSVTGNVGGNVVGSVGSVTGSVGSISGVTFPTNFNLASIDATGSIKIQANVKKNQALTRFEFLITDSTNHAPATGAAATSPTRSIDGGAFAAGTLSAVTEVGNGIYYVDFGAGDLNGNVITLKVTSTNNDTVYATLVTSP